MLQELLTLAYKKEVNKMNKTLNFLKSLHSDLIDGIESGVNTED